MRTPIFNAEASVYKTSNRYRSSGADQNNRNIIIPALPRRDDTGGSSGAQLKADCISDCLDSGVSAKRCVQRCNPRPPPYHCVPQDNSINNFICNTGCDAWGAAASAVCALIPYAFLSASCKRGVDFVVADCKSGCNGPTICV